MITCCVRYKIDMYKALEFRKYAEMWIPLVEKYNGKHHGYFLPKESASDFAIALFSFESLAAYEKYRNLSMHDDDCKAAFEYAAKSKCILSYERDFLDPILSSKP